MEPEYLFEPIFMELTKNVFRNIFMLSYGEAETSIFETSLDTLFTDDLTDIWGQDL